MSWNDHEHRGEYAPDGHEHGYYDLAGVAEEHHRHYDSESEVRGLREDLGRVLERIRGLEDRLGAMEDAIGTRWSGDHSAHRAGPAEEPRPESITIKPSPEMRAAVLAAAGLADQANPEPEDYERAGGQP